MPIVFDTFYKRAGLRLPSQFIAPPKFKQSLFMLPTRSIVHFIPKDAYDTMPVIESLAYNNYSKPIYIHHHTDLLSEIGKPRRRHAVLATEIRKVFISNKRYRRINEVQQRENNDTDIVTVSYAFVNKSIQYMRTIYAGYYEWYNLRNTVMLAIAQMLPDTTRNHFIFIDLVDEVLPPRSILDSAAKQEPGVMNTKQIRLFNSDSSRWFLEIWKWLSADPSKSILGVIPDIHLNRINFVLCHGQGFVLLNLGKLKAWKKATKEEAGEGADTKGFLPIQYQRYFFNLWNKVIATNAIESFEEEAQIRAKLTTKPTDTASPAIAPEAVDTPRSIATDPVNIPEPPAAPGVPEVTVAGKKPQTGGMHTGGLPVQDEEDEVVHTNQLQAYDDSIEESLTALEKINTEILAQMDEQPQDDGVEAQDFGGDDEDEDDEPLPAIAVEEPVTDRQEDAMIVKQKNIANPAEAISQACDQMAVTGTITAPEYRALQKLGESYKKIKAPDGVGTLEAFTQIQKVDYQVEEKIIVPDRPTILDKSMVKTTLNDFDKQYVAKHHQKNIAKMVLGAQYGKVAVTGYEQSRIDEITGSYDVVTVKLQPLDGVPSTINMRLPVIEEDGTFTANGVRYRMRKQQFDVPIRKVGPNRVSLTSYYGKIFVNRTEKKRGNYEAWIGNQLMVKSMEVDSPIQHLNSGAGFDSGFKCPRVYSALGMRYHDFIWNKYHVILSRQDLIEAVGEEAITTLEQANMVVAGYRSTAKGLDYLLIDQNNVWYEYKNDVLEPLGAIEDFLNIDAVKAPVPYVTVKIFGADIPIGFLMAYLLGLDGLLKSLKIQAKHIRVGQRYTLESNEYAIHFADETLVLPKDNAFHNLVLAGLNEYHKALRMYRYHDFNKRAVYANVLENYGLGIRYLRELILLEDMFIDPITLEWLRENKYPENFRGLLAEAVRFLIHDDHPDEVDMAYMRIRGYERFSGTVYQELVKSIRVQRSKSTKQSRVVEMNPHAVWRALQQDSAVMPIKEINPIENLKDQESVTFSGTGGRTGRTMTAKTRKYHPNAMGVASEATVDNGDVGINYYLSANPQLNSVLGTSKRYEEGKTGASSILSTSSLLAPAADKDQARRANFISIQNSHTLPCTGYSQAPIRTGYEQVIPYRVDSMYCAIAQESGTVTAKSDKVLTVQYKSGQRKSFEIGRRYGVAAGMTIPHDLVTHLKAGDKFQADDVLIYHTGFFEQDILNPGKVVYKGSVTANVCLMEDPMTLEDSSVMAMRMAKKLQTSISHVKQVTIRFDQAVTNMLKIGSVVTADDVVCVIEDANMVKTQYYSDQSLDTLKLLSAQTPTVGMDGIVERIEVFYHGEIDDMSESLQQLARQSDSRLLKFRKEMGLAPLKGQVDDSYRIEGEPLLLDNLVIKVYVSANVSAAAADKIVIGNQLKSVVSRLMDDDTMAEDGTPIDIMYSRKGVAARIVNSTDIIGTGTLALELITKKMLEAYDK